MTVKYIHIEKYDFETFEKEKKPYVMICTDVIQRIEMKYSQAFLLWVFLESHSPTWVPNRYHLMQHFQISERTYERHMHWLNTVGLIEYRQNRESGGSFGKGHLVVLNGTKFNPDAVSHGTVKIGGTVVNKKKAKVIHISDTHRDAKNGDSVKPSTSRASTEELKISPNRQITEVRSNAVHINKTKISTKEINKTNNSVSVFSDSFSVKTHIEKVIGNRNVEVDEEIIEQGIYYAYEKNDDKSFASINKRINIFLKKVDERKWLIPHGFHGITSQSIRDTELGYQSKKEKQQAIDASLFQGIVKAESNGEGLKGFSAMVKKMKEETHGEPTNNRAMQKKAL